MPQDTAQRFGSLRTLGKIVRVIGILVALGNALWLISLLANAPEGTGVMLFALAAIAFLFSLAIVALGEMAICFVAIEHNTRRAAEGVASVVEGGSESGNAREKEKQDA